MTKICPDCDATMHTSLAAAPARESLAYDGCYPQSDYPSTIAAAPAVGGEIAATRNALAMTTDEHLGAAPAVGGEREALANRLDDFSARCDIDDMSSEAVDLRDAAAALRAHITAAPAVGGEPVVWRWRPQGSTNWIYDPTDEWRLDNQDNIKFEPLYAAQPASLLRERDLTCSELIAEGIRRACESGMTMRINQAKVIQLHLHEAGYSIVRSSAPPEQPASPLRDEAEIWDNAFEYFKADAARAKLASPLRAAAERVCWFDWSDNDMDAVAAIEALRKAVTS